MDPSEHKGLPPTAPSMRNTATSLGLSPLSPGSPPSSSTPAPARSSRALARSRLSSLTEQNSVSPALLGGAELTPAATSNDDSATVTVAAAFQFGGWHSGSVLHICWFGTAWQMLCDDCIPRRKHWD